MKKLFAHFARPVVAAALVAIAGATAVQAACPYRADFVFERHTVYCTLMAEYQGMCLMDCVSVEHDGPAMY